MLPWGAVGGGGGRRGEAEFVVVVVGIFQLTPREPK